MQFKSDIKDIYAGVQYCSLTLSVWNNCFPYSGSTSS